MTTTYTAKDIEVLEGLEPVRKRPAMYIGGTDKSGYHHLLWEIVDNSVDEAINGHASAIEVTLDADHKGVTVADNGRGIPVDIHPKYKRSALELIEDLVELARDVGLDPREAKAVLDVDRYGADVSEQRAEAAGAGILVPPVLVRGSARLEGFHNRERLGTFLRSS